MAPSDSLILENLDTSNAISIEELISSDTIPFSESYIRSRLLQLSKYGLVHYSEGDDSVNLTGTGEDYRDDPNFASGSEFPLEIEYRLPKVSVSYPPVPWLTAGDLRTLNEISDMDDEASMEDLSSDHKILKASQAEKMADIGLLHKSNMSGYVLSDKGKQLLAGEISQSQAVSETLPTRINILHLFGKKLLSVFGKLDQDRGQVRTDIDDASLQIEPIFLDTFKKRAKFYILIPVLLFATFLFLNYITIFNANLQTYGLILDVVGASLVAVGLFRGITGFAVDVEERGARLAGTGQYPLRPVQLASATADTVDGFFGTMFLVIGFCLQIVSTITITG